MLGFSLATGSRDHTEKVRHEVYFQLGSRVNFADTTATASLSSNIRVSDFNADGVVDGADFIEWHNNKFTSAGSAAVPEATPMWSVLLCLVALRRWRQA